METKQKPGIRYPDAAEPFGLPPELTSIILQFAVSGMSQETALKFASRYRRVCKYFADEFLQMIFQNELIFDHQTKLNYDPRTKLWTGYPIPWCPYIEEYYHYRAFYSRKPKPAHVLAFFTIADTLCELQGLSRESIQWREYFTKLCAVMRVPALYDDISIRRDLFASALGLYTADSLEQELCPSKIFIAAIATGSTSMLRNWDHAQQPVWSNENLNSDAVYSLAGTTGNLEVIDFLFESESLVHISRYLRVHCLALVVQGAAQAGHTEVIRTLLLSAQAKWISPISPMNVFELNKLIDGCFKNAKIVELFIDMGWTLNNHQDSILGFLHETTCETIKVLYNHFGAAFWVAQIAAAASCGHFDTVRFLVEKMGGRLTLRMPDFQDHHLQEWYWFTAHHPIVSAVRANDETMLRYLADRDALSPESFRKAMQIANEGGLTSMKCVLLEYRRSFGSWSSYGVVNEKSEEEKVEDEESKGDEQSKHD